MTVDDSTARKGILYLLFAIPKDVARYYRTPAELTCLLKRGGASVSLESTLVVRALQFASRTDKDRIGVRTTEKIPGLAGYHRTYCLCPADYNATPLSQRSNGKSLPRIEEGYYQNNSAFRPHLLAITKYYADKHRADNNQSSGASSAAISSGSDTDTGGEITCNQLNGSRRVVEIEKEWDMFWRLHVPFCKEGSKLELSTEPSRKGFGTKETHHCTGCNNSFSYRTYYEQRSEVIEPGRSHSRRQPGINLDMAEAAEDEAIGLSNLIGFCVKADIVHPLEKNMRPTQRKGRQAAIETGQECLAENRAKAAEAAAERGDTIEFEKDGKTYIAFLITLAQDGSSLKRDYSHNYTGTAVAQIAMEKSTGLPVALEISQASCVYCVRAMNRRLRDARQKGQRYSLDMLKSMSHEELYRLMDHDGPCYRNSTYSPGTAEEHLAEKIGMELLLDGNGNVQATPLFVAKHVADGRDSKGITRAAEIQREVVGADVADSVGVELCRDWNHLNSLLEKKDMRGLAKTAAYKGALTEERIKRIKKDNESICRRYKTNVIDCDSVTDDNKKKHLKTLLREVSAIIPHHCGMHHNCTDNMCRHRRIQTEHPDWKKEQVIEEWDKGNEFGGEIMAIDIDCINELTKIFTSRITSKTADSVCKMESTTGVEQTNGMTAKYTGAKRKNYSGADGYEAALHRSIGHKSLSKYEHSSRVLSKLGSPHHPCRDAGLKKMDERLERDRKRKAKDDYVAAKHDSKRARSAMRGKGDKKDKEYKYRKGKSTSTAGMIQGGAKRTNKDVTCGQCGQLGHRKTICTIDDTDDVITHNGKKERKNKPGKKKSLQPSKRKKSNNYGVSVADVDSWMPAIVRGNKRRINS